MEILPGVEILDLSLYIKDQDILVISDFHIGFEEALNKQGILIPRFQFDEILDRLKKILKGLKLEKIIIVGDLKHEFGTISETEWRNTLQLLDFLTGFCKDVILIKGNHDTILGPIAAKRNIKVKKTLRVGDFFFCHGDVIPKNISDSKVIIIGHEHPAVGLKKDSRIEMFKCFLKGSWHGKTLIVMPSFKLLREGNDVLNEDILSPFLQQDLSNFSVFIVSDEVYDFGKLKNLKNL
jgi:putative SbcD/Mre11-related phosphoesterase